MCAVCDEIVDGMDAYVDGLIKIQSEIRVVSCDSGLSDAQQTVELANTMIEAFHGTPRDVQQVILTCAILAQRLIRLHEIYGIPVE